VPDNASAAQYGTPTPPPTCVDCVTTPQTGHLPQTGFDAFPLAGLGLAALVAGIAIWRRTRP
jgi:LPXTG-motif cell wall-anchored protein